jgi:hypothetical protein
MATIETAPSRRVDSKWLLVAGFYISAILACFSRAAQHDNALVDYIPNFLMACTAAGWCVVDARRRGKPIVLAVQFIMLIFWSLAVPIYLIATRGWRGVGWVIVNSILLTLVGIPFALMG